MDALGTNCWSESCPALKLQSAGAAIACTKSQQAKEEVNPRVCEYFSSAVGLLGMVLIRCGRA